MKNSKSILIAGAVAAILLMAQGAISSDRGGVAHVWGKDNSSISMDTSAQQRPKCTSCHSTEPTSP